LPQLRLQSFLRATTVESFDANFVQRNVPVRSVHSLCRVEAAEAGAQESQHYDPEQGSDDPFGSNASRMLEHVDDDECSDCSDCEKRAANDNEDYLHGLTLREATEPEKFLPE